MPAQEQPKTATEQPDLGCSVVRRTTSGPDFPAGYGARLAVNSMRKTPRTASRLHCTPWVRQKNEDRLTGIGDAADGRCPPVPDRGVPAGYSLAGCSPADPASASPAAPLYVHRPLPGNHRRCPYFFSPKGSINRSRNQQTACHSRAPSRQSSETKYQRRPAGLQRGELPFLL
jgi:hypothetical protein